MRLTPEQFAEHKKLNGLNNYLYSLEDSLKDWVPTSLKKAAISLGLAGSIALTGMVSGCKQTPPTTITETVTQPAVTITETVTQPPTTITLPPVTTTETVTQLPVTTTKTITTTTTIALNPVKEYAKGLGFSQDIIDQLGILGEDYVMDSNEKTFIDLLAKNSESSRYEILNLKYQTDGIISSDELKVVAQSVKNHYL